MFREMNRKGQQLPQDECIGIQKKELRGFLSVIGDDGYPYGLPINHFYCEEDGKLYFHSGMEGHKIDALRRCDKMSFCVCDEGTKKEGEWAITFRSVIVFGRAEVIEDREKIYDIARKLSYKFTSDEEYIAKEIKNAGPRTFMFALVPEHITGKRVKEA